MDVKYNFVRHINKLCGSLKRYIENELGRFESL